MNEITNEMLERFSREATDRGQIIEAGWIGLRMASIRLTAPQIQIDEMRFAFFAGAQHLFSSIMMSLDPGAEPTDADLNRLTMIQSELTEFVRQYKLKHNL